MIAEVLLWLVRASMALSDIMARALLVYYAIYAMVILIRITYGLYVMARNNQTIRQAMRVVYNVNIILIDLVVMPILLGALCCDLVLLVRLLKNQEYMNQDAWYHGKEDNQYEAKSHTYLNGYRGNQSDFIQ